MCQLTGIIPRPPTEPYEIFGIQEYSLLRLRLGELFFIYINIFIHIVVESNDEFRSDFYFNWQYKCIDRWQWIYLLRPVNASTVLYNLIWINCREWNLYLYFVRTWNTHDTLWPTQQETDTPTKQPTKYARQYFTHIFIFSYGFCVWIVWAVGIRVMRAGIFTYIWKYIGKHVHQRVEWIYIQSFWQNFRKCFCL